MDGRLLRIAAVVVGVGVFAGCGGSVSGEEDVGTAEEDAVRGGKKACIDPLREYVSRSETRCTTMTWECGEGFVAFSDICGCGCESCDQPDREYVARDPVECAQIRFLCPEGMDRFDDACGCGCEPL